MDNTQQALQQAHTYMLGELLKCCEAWEPEVRILGNVRAGDAATAIRAAIAALSLPVEAPSESVREQAVAEPVAYMWSPPMSRKRFLSFDLPDVECDFSPLYASLPDARLQQAAERVRQLACGTVEWRVQHPVDKSYCMNFSHATSFNPEREAREWLADHRQRFPGGRFADYEVAEVRCFSELERAGLELADAALHQAHQKEGA